MAQKTQTLPATLISKVDLSRLVREVRAIDEFLHQANLRKAGQKVQLPRTTASLEETAQSFGCNLLDKTSRTELLTTLNSLQKEAPTVHISFAATPNAQFLGKLIAWLRREIHPQLLIQIGLQPTIAAGCIVRTPNHYYDLSLRKKLQEQQKLLVQQLQEKL